MGTWSDGGHRVFGYAVDTQWVRSHMEGIRFVETQWIRGQIGGIGFVDTQWIRSEYEVTWKA